MLDFSNLFNVQYSTPQEVSAAGQNFILILYNPQYDETTLYKLRCRLYAKYFMKTHFKLASLPPTKDAAKQHSFGTFL